MVTATRTVIATDTRPPILTLIGANPMNLDLGTPFVDPGATASDACDGDLTASIVLTGAVNSAVPGSYTLTYTVADASGNSTTTNRTVLIRGWPTVSGVRVLTTGTNAITGAPVAQFLADVSPNGLPSTAFIEYGLTTAYPGRTATVSLAAGYGGSTFFATLDNLVPGLVYHCRVAASNSLGEVYGPDQMITLPALFAAGDFTGDGRVDASELNTVLSNYWASNLVLTMTNPVALGGGVFQFALSNQAGWNFSVLASTNLTTWELIGGARPVFQFRDPAGTNALLHFYRLRWP